MIDVVQGISLWAIPLVVVTIPIVGLLRGVKVYEVFCQGAKEGFETAIQILPYLVAMFVAIGVFRATHAFDSLLHIVAPLASKVGIPVEVIPMALLRPLSGSGTLGVLADLLGEHGADSLIGMIASTMQGSTETTFYILTVYFGAVGVTRARHSVAVGLLADLAGFIASVAVVQWVFRL